MHTINTIEIDFEGKVHSPKQLSFYFSSQINEMIILNNSAEIPNAYKVLEVHHIPGNLRYMLPMT